MRGKVKTILALLCSLLFLIACYTIVYLFFRNIKSFSNIEGDPSGLLIIYFLNS